MHVCLGGLTLGHESQRLLTSGIVKPRVRDDRLFQSAADQSRHGLLELDKKTPTFNLSCFHLAFKSVCHLSFATKCAYVYECEWVRMCPAHSCVQYEAVCTDFLSLSVILFCFFCFFYWAGTNWWQPLLEPLWLSAPFLPWSQEPRT